MPNWKKVITSGSDASLNTLNATTSLTGSNLLVTDVATYNSVEFSNSNIMKFNQVYTGASTGSYFTNGEYQKVITITPTAASQNYQVVGRITAQNAGETHTVYFNAALRSETLPDLGWTINYEEEYNGSRYIDPQLWTKETATAGFIFAFKTLGTIFGTVTVDIDVIPRFAAHKANVSINTVVNSEQASIDSGFTANDMVKSISTINDDVTFAGNAAVTGDLTVTGTISASEINTTVVSSSITFSSGSNIFGDEASDQHQFTGSIDVSGTVTATAFAGPLTGNITGNAATVTNGVYTNTAQTITGRKTFQTDSDYIIGLNDSSGVSQWWIKGYTNGNFALHENGVGDQFTIKAGGSVGIGTTSPLTGFNLDVRGGDFRVGDDGNQGFEAGYSSGGGVVFLQGYNRGTSAFVDMSINASITVKAGGNVGIGAENPSAKLHVSGASDVLLIEGSGSTVFEIQGSEGQLFSVTDDLSGDLFSVSDISGVPLFNVNASDESYFTGDLDVQGSFTGTTGTFTGDITAFSSSDKRLKSNIKPIENATDKIKAIGGYTFDWNEDIGDITPNTGRDIGVIAQEIEEVAPELVHTRKNGYKAVEYQKLVALLIESNKELAARVEELESKIK